MQRLGPMLAWTMVVLSVLAAGAYGAAHDWRRAIYWMAAAVLQAAVTWPQTGGV